MLHVVVKSFNLYSSYGGLTCSRKLCEALFEAAPPWSKAQKKVGKRLTFQLNQLRLERHFASSAIGRQDSFRDGSEAWKPFPEAFALLARALIPGQK